MRGLAPAVGAAASMTVIFIASLGTQLGFPELVGAAMLAGVCVLVLGPLGVPDRLAAWLPAPIVFGLPAGAVMPFVVDVLGVFDDARLVVGGAVVAYVLGRRFLEPRTPAILGALVVGAAVAGLTGPSALRWCWRSWPGSPAS